MTEETVTLSLTDLDALIERKMAEKAAAAAAPKKGVTRDCNCRADGYLLKMLHQFGCPYAARDVAAQTRWLGGEES